MMVDDDVDFLLALEQEIARELEMEAIVQAEGEAESLLELQNAEDSALFEQHLLGGVPCPLCSMGRLEVHEELLLCTACPDMRSSLADGSLSVEDISEMLGLAEERHRWAGCSSRANFEVCQDLGPPLLFLRCTDCGWHEIV